MKKAITAAEAKSITTPGSHRAGVTLYLHVAPGGSKSWIQRLTIHGRRCDLGLGGYPVVTLAEARDKAYQNRRVAQAGGDPLAKKRAPKLPTFREAAEKTFEANRTRWRRSKTAKTWERSMQKRLFPTLGSLRVDRVSREHVLRILTPIWNSKPAEARKLRGHIRTMLAWCQAHSFIEHNVAGELINGALPSRRVGSKNHFRALPYDELPAVLDTVTLCNASVAARLCFRFLVLTAARSGEARGAVWTEIDIEKREWRIPAERMKAGAEHRVPLSDETLAVLEQAKMLTDRSGLVFPSIVRPGKPMSDMTLTKVLRDNGLADRTTVHGLRSSFRDWCAETGKPRELAEAALAHAVSGVEGAYFRSDLFERRRSLMAQWAAFATHKQGDVVQLREG